ncbi:MAG TPA: fumarylacetoacetate hydrolase family protein, partial [Candidatus Limnocylindrales bacterium]|nr:fumarylacetoacetate hydrolase family protein [Candidatus Limnocylindrales bacterium]
MKLVTFIHQDKERIGAVDNLGRIVDLHRAYASHLQKVESTSVGDRLAEIVLGRDMVEFLKRGNEALAAARNALDHIASYDVNSGGVFDRGHVRLKSPVPRPGALISAGKNFSDHVAEMAAKKGPTAPVAFLKLPGTVIGPEDNIPHPPEVKNLDYEVEVAIVIGKPCIDVSEEEALNYVAGYSAFNDISARDVIRGENKN